MQTPPKDLKITVRDAGGAVVRDISGEALKDVRRAGINRIYWDLRHDPLPAPRPPLTQGGGGGVGATLDGPFVLPGEYRVTLSVNGRDVGTRPVRVNGDVVMQITEADRKTLHDTALALHELQRTANEAAEAALTMSEQVKDFENGLKQTTSRPPDAVRSVVEEVSKQLMSVRRQLAVPAPGQVGGFGGGGDSPPVRTLIATLKGQVMASTSVPTEVQITQTREARAELMKAVEGVNALITQAMPRLYRALSENNLLLVPVKPAKAITTASLQK